jgi:hypothetical protein
MRSTGERSGCGTRFVPLPVCNLVVDSLDSESRDNQIAGWMTARRIIEP